VDDEACEGHLIDSVEEADELGRRCWFSSG